MEDKSEFRVGVAGPHILVQVTPEMPDALSLEPDEARSVAHALLKAADHADQCRAAIRAAELKASAN